MKKTNSSHLGMAFIFLIVAMASGIATLKMLPNMFIDLKNIFQILLGCTITLIFFGFGIFILLSDKDFCLFLTNHKKWKEGLQ